MNLNQTADKTLENLSISIGNSSKPCEIKRLSTRFRWFPPVFMSRYLRLNGKTATLPQPPALFIDGKNKLRRTIRDIVIAKVGECGIVRPTGDLMRKIQFCFLPFLLAMFASNSPSSSAGSTTGYLLTANKGEQSLGIIDPQTAKQLATVPEGGITGHEVIASPDGRLAYVPIYGNSGVGKPGTDGTNMVVIDLATQKVVGNVDFGHAVRPHCPVFNPKTGMLYVTTELDKTISVIDPKTLKIVDTVPTGSEQSHMLAISKDGRYGYTANVGPGTVSVLDLHAKKVVKIIPISKMTQRISLSPDDKWVFTSDQTKPQLAVIDAKHHEVKSWVELPGLGYGTASTSDGRWLIVAVPTVNKVSVIDLKTLKVARSIDVPKAPQEVLVRPDDKVAYVSCDSSHQIAAINLDDWSVTLIDAGKGTDGLAWASGTH